MKKFGPATCTIGALVLLASFAMETAPEGTYNVGLLQQQMMVFGLGAVLAILGTLIGSVAQALAVLEPQRPKMRLTGDR